FGQPDPFRRAQPGDAQALRGRDQGRPARDRAGHRHLGRPVLSLAMRVGYEHVIPPKHGHGLTVTTGQVLRVTDLEGKQVVDMALFGAENPREKLSTSYSRTRYVPKPGAEYVPRDRLTEGDTLMSTL